MADVGTFRMKKETPGKKRPYSAPTVRKLTLEQAKRFVAERTKCSDAEATELLESLRREQQSRVK